MPTQPHSWPWNVLIEREAGKLDNMCGGALIDHNWICMQNAFYVPDCGITFNVTLFTIDTFFFI